MELTNQTEQDYQLVQVKLTEINIKVPAAVKMMANIVGICNSIAKGEPHEQIIAQFELGVKPDSFSTMFKNTTGVSTRDIPSMRQFDRRRVALRDLEYAEDEIDKILYAISSEA